MNKILLLQLFEVADVGFAPCVSIGSGCVSNSSQLT